MVDHTKPLAPVDATDGDISLIDLPVILAEGFWKVVAGAVLAGVLAIAIVLALPKLYSSDAYLKLTEDGVDQAWSFISSPAVVDKVLVSYPQPGDTMEERRQRLTSRIKWDAEPEGLTVLSALDEDPQRAQAINSAIIETWLAVTKPGPDDAAELSARLENARVRLGEASELIERLSSETPTLIVPGVQTELATSLADLQAERDSLVTQIRALERDLSGVSRDVVIVPPLLPTQAQGMRPVMTGVVAALVTAAVLVVLVLIAAAFRFSAQNPANAAKVDRIKRGFIFWRKSPATAGKS